MLFSLRVLRPVDINGEDTFTVTLHHYVVTGNNEVLRDKVLKHIVFINELLCINVVVHCDVDGSSIVTCNVVQHLI